MGVTIDFFKSSLAVFAKVVDGVGAVVSGLILSRSLTAVELDVENV